MYGRLSFLFRSSLVVLALLPLALFVYLGQFSRFISDDYRNIAAGIEMGPWGGMLHWLNNWLASYTSSFLMSFLAPLDTWAPRIMPALFSAIWLVGAGLAGISGATGPAGSPVPPDAIYRG